MFFEVLGLLERYHPRRQLRMQLARIMVLNLLNLYALIFALFDKISKMSEDSQCQKRNISNQFKSKILAMRAANAGFDSKHLLNDNDGYDMYTGSDFYTESYLSSTLPDITTAVIENTTRCYQIAVSCMKPTTFNQTLITSMFIMNLTSTMLPEYMGNRTNPLFLNYDDANMTNLYEDYDLFDNSTDGLYNWMGNLTDYSNRSMTDANATRRFKREYDYDDDASNEIREANFYNAISDFYANLQDGTNGTTSFYGNVSDIYATISTIIDNITSTSWSDENITDYERKCWLNVGIVNLSLYTNFLAISIEFFFSSRLSMICRFFLCTNFYFWPTIGSCYHIYELSHLNLNSDFKTQNSRMNFSHLFSLIFQFPLF